MPITCDGKLREPPDVRLILRQDREVFMPRRMGNQFQLMPTPVNTLAWRQPVQWGGLLKSFLLISVYLHG